MDSSNCLSYKKLVILHKLRCANCVTKILYFFHTTKLSVPVFSNFCLHTDFHFCPELSRLVLGPTDQREVIIEFLSSHGISRTVTVFLFLFLSRIIELSNFYHPWPSAILRVIIRNNSQIRKFVTEKDYSAILRVIIRNNSLIRKFVTKIIPWYSVTFRVIKDNSIIL